jgi:ribonuclease D
VHAARLDVPVYQVLTNEVLVAIAKAKPTTLDAMRRVRGATSGSRAGAMAPEMVDAVAQGLSDRGIPEEERAMLERPRIAPAIAKAQRARESRLMAWRKEAAKQRGVDEQVILPGHCVKRLAQDPPRDAEGLAMSLGVGQFRVERYGQAILHALGGGAP